MSTLLQVAIYVCKKDRKQQYKSRPWWPPPEAIGNLCLKKTWGKNNVGGSDATGLATQQDGPNKEHSNRQQEKRNDINESIQACQNKALYSSDEL